MRFEALPSCKMSFLLPHPTPVILSSTRPPMHKLLAFDCIPALPIPCPLSGDTMGLLSRPSPSVKIGQWWRDDERLHIAVMATPPGGHLE